MRNRKQRRWSKQPGIRASMAAVLCIVGGLLGGVALARVSPINQIGRQVQKGNMLVVMDTSGSMTGVPGEIFDINTELGVDCELGQNCRTVSQTGRCSISVDPISSQKRICANDAHCKTGRCRDGGDPCLQDADCPSTGSNCSQTGEACQYNSDCGPVFAQCSGGVGTCSSINPNSCPAIGKCDSDDSPCSNPGGRCPASFCSNDATLACTRNSDCGSGGSQIPAAGLVVHYPFEETLGTNVNDTSANNLDGTQLGDQTWWADGKVNRSLELGWGESVLIADGAGIDSLGTNNKMSISVWINPTSSNWNHIASRQIAGTERHHFYLRFHSNRIYFAICNTTDCSEVGSSVTVPIAGGYPTFSSTNWTHVAGTFDGTTIALYVNGTAAGTGTTSRAMTVDTTPVYVGAFNRASDGLGGHYVGLIDEFRLYNTALAASDIQAVYQQTIPPAATPPPPGSGLVGHWNMDEASGNTRSDTSGSGNHLNWVANYGPWSDTGGAKLEGAASLGGGGDLHANASASLDSITTNQSFTVAGWFKRNDTTTWDSWLISRDSSPGQAEFTATAQQFGLRVSPAATLSYCVTVANNAYNGCFGGTSNTTKNVWQHIALTFDGERFRAFLDGAKVLDNPAAVTLPTATGPFRFGKQSESLFWYDDWYLYNRALSQKEILGLMENVGLIGDWKFEDGAGDTVADTSGRGSPGILHVGSGSVKPTRVAGIIGNALNFGNNAGHVEIARTAALDEYVDRGRYTAMTWFKPDTLIWQDMIHRWTGRSDNRVSFQLGMSSATVDSADTRNSTGSGTNASGATELSVGRWTHLASTFNYSRTTLYRNADSRLEGGTITPGGLDYPSQPLTLGIQRRYNLTNGFEYTADARGTMDETRLYSRAMKPEEIAGQTLKAGLVTYQSFDQGAVSGGTKMGTLNTINGRRYQGLRFDGSNSNYVAVGPNALTDSINTTKEISFALWVKRIGNGDAVLVHQQKDTGGQEPYYVVYNGSGALVVENTTDNQILPLNEWHHIAVTINDATNKVRYYKDGVEDDQSVTGMTAARTFDSASIGAVTIGAQREGSGIVSGAVNAELDEVYVYNRVLSPTEIRVLAEQPINTYVTPPVNPVENTEALLAHWRLDGNLTDVSGNNNHLVSLCGTPGYETGYAGSGVTLTQGSAQPGTLMSPPALLNGKAQYSISLFMRNRGGFTADHENIITRQTAVGDNGQSLQLMAADHVWCPEWGANCPTQIKGRLWWQWTNTFVNPKLYEATAWPSTWTHFVITVDTTTGTARWYKNGTLMKNVDNADIVYTATSLQAAISGRPLVFGAHKADTAYNACSGFNEGANFSVDEIRVYGRILPPSEIGQLAAGQPPTTTSFCTENNCTAAANDCPGTISQNICTGSTTNACEGVNTGDLCIVTSTNPGPARMCQFGMRLCTVDSDCTQYPGDQCVPSTSRAVVAKRVLKNTMLRNIDVMNFGLMTFSQGRPTANLVTYPSGREDYYFPYYPQVAGSPVVVRREIRFFSRQQLEDIPVPGAPGNDAFDISLGPVSSFADRGIAYTLPTLAPFAGQNSRYAIFQGSGNYANVDKSWNAAVNCEYYCDIVVNSGFNFGDDDDSDTRGTGVYQGTYYEFTVSTTTTNQFSNAPKHLTTYQGRATTIGGVLHNYFKPKTDYYWDPQAGANRPGISGPLNCEYTSQCSDTCGAWWDPNMMPSLYTGTDQPTIDANMAKMLARLEKAQDGGLMMWERTPIGCALKNDGTQMYNMATGLSNGLPMPQSDLAQMKKYSAYHHIKDVMMTDPLACRENFVVMLTDGMATGPGDVHSASGDYGDSRCDDTACFPADPNTDPSANGCTCKSVNAAYRIRKDIETEVEAARTGLNFKPVKTYVVGFSPDATIGPPAFVNSNIARAGGTCADPTQLGFNAEGNRINNGCAFKAQNEIQLTEALQSVVFEAIKGSYSTSPLTAASGTQADKTIIASTIVLDSRVNFPSWEGNLIAYETDLASCVAAGSPVAPCVLWNVKDINDGIWADSGGTDPNGTWADRNVYFWDTVTNASNPVLTKIRIDKSVPTDPKITNRVLLHQLGLGATPEEAQLIALWMLGDPRQGNKATFGAFVNSTPTDVGPPGNAKSLPGGTAFHDAYLNRPNLVYVGSDDGMLHAFYKKDITLGGRLFKAGQEAFAFFPPEMLKTVTRLYAQGGQMADPMQHVYGLAQSPKVKNLCATPLATDPYCGSDGTAGPYWKSFLSMTSGWGENEAWTIDITNAFNNNAGTPTALQDPPFRVVWHSDHVSLPSDKTAYDQMLGNTASVPAFYFGKGGNNNDQRLIFTSGYQNQFEPHPSQGLSITSVSAIDGHLIDSDPLPVAAPSCTNGVERTALTDVATARNHARYEKGQILAAYFGDTWGNLYRYVPVVDGLGNTTSGGAVNLVQAFGCDAPLHFSPTIVQLDRDDPANHSGQIYIVQVTNSTLDKDTQPFGRSRLVIRKDRALGGLVAPDAGFTTITYQMGDSVMCANWDPTGNTCLSLIPNDARPTATPMAVLKADGSGFQIFTLWYSGSTTGCGQGQTFLTLHEVTSIGGVTVKAGLTLANQPVTSAIIAGDKVLYSRRSASGAPEIVDITSQMNQTFVVGGAISPNTLNGGMRLRQTGWNELP